MRRESFRRALGLALGLLAGCGSRTFGDFTPSDTAGLGVGAGGGGGSAPTGWELASSDFDRPWIRLSVPTGPLESVISVSLDPQGYVALVRYQVGSKVIDALSHRLALSSDGVTWSSRDFDSSQDFSQGQRFYQAIAFGGGRYVVVGNGGTGSLLRVSSDATQWTPVSVGGAGLGCVAFVGGRWLVGGPIGYVATSLDGFAWSMQKLDDGAINDVAFGDGVYVAAGNVAFWVSRDAQIWDQVNVICESPAGCPNTLPGSGYPAPAVVAADHIFHGPQKFYAASWSSGYHFVSPDGRQWQVVPAGQPAPDLYRGGRFLAIGTDGVVQGSADAASWTLRTTLTDDNPEGRSCASDRCFVWRENVILVPGG